MGLHLARFESRILGEKHVIVTVSRDETTYPFENSVGVFLRTVKFYQTYRHTNAKAAA